MIIKRETARIIVGCNASASVGAGTGLLISGHHIVAALLLLVTGVSAWMARTFGEDE